MPFDMRRANTARVRVAVDADWDSLHNLTWAAPLLTLTGSGIDLDELGEVYAVAENHMGGIDIMPEAVCVELIVATM